MRQDIRLLRHRVMRLPFIEHIQAAWLVHGGSSVMLRWNTIDKWSVSLCGLGCDVSLLCPVSNDNTRPGIGRYGTKVVRYLEDGDTVEDAELYNGALIQPVLDDGEYGILLCFVSLWLLFPFCY